MMTIINIHQLIGILTNEPVIIIIQLLAHSNFEKDILMMILTRFTGWKWMESAGVFPEKSGRTEWRPSPTKS